MRISSLINAHRVGKILAILLGIGVVAILALLDRSIKDPEVASSESKKEAAAADDSSKIWTLDELQARGEKVYAANCQVCHQPNGMGQPPVFPPLSGSKIVTGPKDTYIAIVLKGKPGTAMVPFDNRLSDTDIAAVITFTRNRWTNKSGEATQPADIAAKRR